MTEYKDSSTRWQFANIEQLVDYIAHEFEIEPLSKRLIRVTGSQVERFRNKGRAKKGNAILFQNPILDHITSSNGELVIGSQSFIVQARRLRSSKRGIPTLQPPANHDATAHEHNCIEDFTGLEFCPSDDGRIITYSDGAGSSIVFSSYSDTWGWFFWEIGTDIQTFGPNLFQAANINSRYYANVYAQICSVEYDQDSDFNDDHLNENTSYFGDLLSPKPLRLESLCRVQWNGYRLKGVVTWGDEPCPTDSVVTPWPEEWPENWPPITEPDPGGAIGVSPLSIAFHPKTGTSVTKFITITNTHPNDVIVTVEEAKVDTTDPAPTPIVAVGASGVFSNASGPINIPHTGPPVQIAVTFLVTKNGFGSVAGSLRITWDSEVRDVALLGTIEQVFI